MMTDLKISEKSAREQIEAFEDYFGLDLNDLEVDNGAEAVKTIVNGLVRMIRQGLLEISLSDGKFSVIQTLRYPINDDKSFTYSGKTGKASLAMDSAKSGKDQARMYTFMASLAGVPVPTLLKLEGIDVTAFNRLAVLFSMV